MKNVRVFLSENFHILVATFSVYVNRHVLVMEVRAVFSDICKAFDRVWYKPSQHST